MATTRLPGSLSAFLPLLCYSSALPEPWPASHTHGLSRFNYKAIPSGLLPDKNSRRTVTVLTALWATSSSLLSGFLSPAYSQNLARCLLLKTQWSLGYLVARTLILAWLDTSWAHLHLLHHCLCLFFLTQEVILSLVLSSSLMNSKNFNQNEKEKNLTACYIMSSRTVWTIYDEDCLQKKKELVFSTPWLPWQYPNTFTSLQGIQWLQMVGTAGVFEENYLQTTKISKEIFSIIFQNFKSIIVWCFTELKTNETAKIVLRLKNNCRKK